MDYTQLLYFSHLHCTQTKQVTMPAAHHSNFYRQIIYRSDALPIAQPTASKMKATAA